MWTESIIGDHKKSRIAEEKVVIWTRFNIIFSSEYDNNNNKKYKLFEGYDLKLSNIYLSVDVINFETNEKP